MDAVVLLLGVLFIASGIMLFSIWYKIARSRFAWIFLIEMSALFILIGLAFILPFTFQPIGYLFLFDFLSMIATMVIWSIYSMLKLDTSDINYSDEPEGKHKNDEKRKRQPAYWEPKKKKRGLPPDQGGVG